jgi:DNA-binding transcriptional LysR family regulator
MRVEGQLLAFDSAGALLNAGLKGFLIEGQVQPYVSNDLLVRVLSDWCSPFLDYRLYCASRHQLSPAFSLLVDADPSRRSAWFA